MTRFLIVLLLAHVPSVAHAVTKAPKGTVVDLGDLEIEGDIRRPTVQMIESDRVQIELLKKAAERSLADLEEGLLAPKKVPEKARVRR